MMRVLVASYILKDGEFEPDEGYHRGPMIVYSEEEWKGRMDLYIKRAHFMWMVKGYLGAMGVPLIFLAFYLYDPDADTQIPMNWLAFSMGVLLTIQWIVLTVYGLRAIANSPLYGLYENGFQHNHRSFYPYGEIDRIELRRVGRKGKVIPYLHFTAGPGPDAEALPWSPRSCIYEFLGEDGVRELEKRVHAEGSPE